MNYDESNGNIAVDGIDPISYMGTSKPSHLNETVTKYPIHYDDIKFNNTTAKIATNSASRPDSYINKMKLTIENTKTQHHNLKYSDHNPNAKTYGVFQKYPAGVFNPAFTGMFLFDYSTYKELSEYKICKFHSIKGGIILYGSEAFVFTPLSNNDIQSYIKILLRDKPLPSSITKSKATKLIVDYIRQNCKRPIIPCLHTIRNYLQEFVGLSEVIFDGDHNSFNTLLHRTYMFMYMLHYNMPLQRKNTPGKRNLASSVYCGKRKGWYSYLSDKEQKILDRESIFVSVNSIPDDLINGIPIKEVSQSNIITSTDRINTCMIRDGSSDCVTFQCDVKLHAHTYKRKKTNIPTLGETKKIDCIQEVPNIDKLRDTVGSYMVGLNPNLLKASDKSWNGIFQHVLTLCGMENIFPLSELPECYKPGDSCGHLLHVELDDSASNTLQLTMLESTADKSSSHSLEVASAFIYSMIFHNPIWDLGLQFAVAKKNAEKLFSVNKESSQKYTSKCICPCSALLSDWHELQFINKLPTFHVCKSTVFNSPSTFVEHLHSMKDDYYHRIVMRQVQNLYSSLISKLKLFDWNTGHPLKRTTSTFKKIAKGKVTLHPHIVSGSTYDTFTVER